MKWIKASERLPDFEGVDKLYFTRYSRSDEKALMDLEELSERRDDSYVIEWLDESDHSDEEAAFTKRGIDLLEDIESEILSFMMATENQMLKKGLRETVQIVQRHKKKILDNPTFTDYLKSKQEL